MDYQYDVFISYKRGWRTESWLIESFLPLFSSYLNDRIYQYCRREPCPIFLDQTELNLDIRSDHRLANFRGIEPGLRWQKELEHAIQHSRCLVALWSPSYFFSDWCMKEWSNFQFRQALDVDCLCEPIVVHDCEDPATLPPNLSPFQKNDEFKRTVFVGPAFKDSPEYILLQHLCDQLAHSVAKKIAKAPDFQLWPIVQGPPTTNPNPIGQSRMVQ